MLLKVLGDEKAGVKIDISMPCVNVLCLVLSSAF